MFALAGRRLTGNVGQNKMIPLDSSQWLHLEHAYGSAANIPALLARLSSFPKEESGSEPFHALWSALCHQDDVYSASYAAVPHIVSFVESDPRRASMSYYALPTAIEIDRAEGRGPALSSAEESEYFAALQRLAHIAAEQLKQNVDGLRSRYLRGAVAVGRGEIALASSIINPDDE